MRVGIVLLNWNSAVDTVECLKSIESLVYREFEVIVVDNNSSSGDYLYLKEFIKSRDYINISLIRNGDNLGFAKANNIGANYLIELSNVDLIWILNNDTVVDSMSLNYLVEKIDVANNVHICGSTMAYYNDQNRIQTIGGGSYWPFFGLTRLIGKGRPLNQRSIINLKRLTYIMGCSLLISSKSYIELSGFDESYFVYGEDLDLCLRARKSGVQISVATESIVFHKDGGSTSNKKDYFYYLFASGSIKNVLRYFPQYKFFAIISILLNGLIKSRSKSSLKSLLRGIREAIKSEYERNKI